MIKKLFSLARYLDFVVVFFCHAGKATLLEEGVERYA